MNCKVCGSEIPDGSSFCRVCGAPAEAAPTYAPPVQQSSLRCGVCGNSITPGTKFCNVCGNPSVPAEPAAPSYAAPAAPAAPAVPKGAGVKEKLNQVLSFAKEPKNRTPLMIALGAIALILVVALLIGSVSGGPAAAMSKAVKKTIIGGNFTAEFEIEYMGNKVTGTAMVNMNVKKHTITALVEMKMDGEKLVAGIYEEEAFLYYPEYKSGSVMDIGSELDDIFEKYEEVKDLDLESILELIKDMTGNDLEDYIDVKAAEKGIKKLGAKFNSKSWLKENAGYETEKKNGATIHVFEPDMYDLLMASVGFFEDAIEDYDDVVDTLEDGEDYLSDIDVTVEIGIKSNKLTLINLELMNTVEISVEFSDVGKTKIDVEELQDYIDDCE